MNILVTGAKGFVGASLTHALVADEQVTSVTCIDLKDTPGRLHDVRQSITLLGGGLGTADLADVMQRHRIDAVAHMVFFASSPEDPAQINIEIEAMVHGATQVIEAARVCGIRRVVLPSSVHFYGPQWRHGDVWLTEDAVGLADTLYGVGKSFIETVAHTYNTRSDMEIVSFRIPVVYGPGAKVGARGVNIPAVAAATGQPGRVPYGPEEQVCAVHVDDVAAALRAGLTNPFLDHEIYNVGGHVTSFRQLRNIARREVADADIGFSDVEGPIELPYLIDDSRLRHEFGFEHRPFEANYRQLIRSMMSTSSGQE